MGELKLLCQELDDLTLEYFSLLDQVYAKTGTLETCLKDGYILMAKARYSMGAKAVGALQYHQEDMEASIAFSVTDVDLISEISVPQLSIGNPSVDNVTDKERVGESQILRKRNVPVAGEGDHEVKDLINGVEDLDIKGKTDIQNGNANVSDHGDAKPPSPKRNDPLKWFGVLVPQSLRQAQSKFKMVASLSGELANLKIKLSAVQTKLKQSMQRKNEIIGVDDDYMYVSSISDSLMGNSLSSSTASTGSSLNEQTN